MPQTEPTGPHQPISTMRRVTRSHRDAQEQAPELPTEAIAQEQAPTEASSPQPPPQPLGKEAAAQPPLQPLGMEAATQPPPQPLGKEAAAAQPPPELAVDLSQRDAHATPSPTHSEPSDPIAQGGTPGVLEDDGSRRWCMRRPLRGCPEAHEACEQDLDESEAKGLNGKKKRKRNKKRKKQERAVQGLGKPRGTAPLESKPELVVVGDAEFASSPMYTKMITTIRLLTLANLPGPYRSYNMFPLNSRLEILHQFMQRYTWGADEDIGRCLDVFENIAADAYSRELTEARRVCRRNLGEDKELWKSFPPRWCRNPEH